jgi:hypothetical protein
MKIVRKRTVTEMGGGATVIQTAWQTMAYALVQCEFEAEYPLHPSMASVTGAMGIFLGKQVERIRFMLSPSDISQPSAPAYDQMDLNLLEFEGTIVGGDYGFSDKLAVKPTFNKYGGWEFEFAEATSQFGDAPHKLDEQIAAERIAANCICTESFKISIGRHNPTPTFAGLFGIKHKIPVGTEILASVILRDTEGLRMAISDITGEAYLNRLLRMHGCEIDPDGANMCRSNAEGTPSERNVTDDVLEEALRRSPHDDVERVEDGKTKPDPTVPPQPRMAEPLPPRPSSGKVRVDWGDWTIVGNDLVRQYDFQNLPFAEKLMLQIRITVEIGSFGIAYSHPHLIMKPPISREREITRTIVCDTEDRSVEVGPMQVGSSTNLTCDSAAMVSSTIGATRSMNVIAGAHTPRY